MDGLRQGSSAKRVAVSVIALYALLLQAFVAAAAPVAAFDPFDITCSQDATQSGAPGGENRHHHGLCCVVACVACGCAFIAAASGVAFFPVRKTSAIDFALTPAVTTQRPLKFYLAARGPPPGF